jgi:hypothetical protein
MLQYFIVSLHISAHIRPSLEEQIYPHLKEMLYKASEGLHTVVLNLGLELLYAALQRPCKAFPLNVDIFVPLMMA